MFLENNKKTSKFTASSLPLAAQSLASVPSTMQPLAEPVADLLSAIVRHTPVDIAESYRDQNGDWFRLASPDLQDPDVYRRLSNNWDAISGPNRMKFSLIHCSTEPHRGIWLLHRKLVEISSYPPGCRQIHSWS